jgi:hypothetical protein
MVAGAGTRPTNERVGRVIVLEEYPVLNTAKRRYKAKGERQMAKSLTAGEVCDLRLIRGQDWKKAWLSLR